MLRFQFLIEKFMEAFECFFLHKICPTVPFCRWSFQCMKEFKEVNSFLHQKKNVGNNLKFSNIIYSLYYSLFKHSLSHLLKWNAWEPIFIWGLHVCIVQSPIFFSLSLIPVGPWPYEFVCIITFGLWVVLVGYEWIVQVVFTTLGLFSWTLFYVYCCWLAGIGVRLYEVRTM